MSVAVKPAPMVEQPRTDAEYQAAVRAMFARLDELDVQIRQDQADIDRLKVETRAILKTIKAANGRDE